MIRSLLGLCILALTALIREVKIASEVYAAEASAYAAHAADMRRMFLEQCEENEQ